MGWGGVGLGVVWWLRPILVFSLSLGQAEQKDELWREKTELLNKRLFKLARAKVLL